MIQKLYLIIAGALFSLTTHAQIGGESTYQFLENPISARVAALGGVQTALNDSTDLSLVYGNPALLKKNMHNRLIINYINYLADVNYGLVLIARSYDKIGNFAAGIQYINYGNFKEALESGELTGNTFNAAEYAFHFIYSKQYGRLHYGINFKPIYSSFENYHSFGLAADFGFHYISGLTSFALGGRNAGSQISRYYDGAPSENLPFNLQIGISRRLEHAPITLAATLQNINHWKLYRPEEEPEFSTETIYSHDESFAKQFMRHMVFGAEIAPSDNFTLRFGYNYQRRQELKFDDRASTVGLSMGFGLKMKRFRLDYGIARYHLAGSSSLFSLSIDLNNNF